MATVLETVENALAKLKIAQEEFRDEARRLEELRNSIEGQTRELTNQLQKLQQSVQTDTLLVKDKVGIRTAAPVAKLSLGSTADDTTETNINGITWSSDSEPLNFGIYRTPGSWGAVGFQQLLIRWKTGIVLEPGVQGGSNVHGYVLVNGNTRLEGTVYVKDVGLLHEVINNLQAQITSLSS